MSMNLFFKIKNSKHGWIDFPFQTPTDLSQEVINEKDNDKRLSILIKYMDDCEWDKITKERIYDIVKELLFNENIELGIS